MTSNDLEQPVRVQNTIQVYTVLEQRETRNLFKSLPSDKKLDLSTLKQF